MRIQLRTIALLAALAAFSLSTKAQTNVFHVTGGNGSNYTIDGASDPALTLVRGFTYEFQISVSAIHPFFIRTVAGANYNDGVSAQGVTSGSIFFTLPNGAPDQLKYQCGVHAGMTGPLNIVDPPTVSITDFSVGTNVVIQSTGTNILNLSVLTSTNLTTNVWSSASIQSNVFSNGTNTTHVALPAGDAAFFQVQQGFF